MLETKVCSEGRMFYILTNSIPNISVLNSKY